MPTLEIGPVGKAVAANVKQRRGSLSLRALEGKLRDLDRPILASGLLKIEHGERRVDVDDLAALAEALDVSPSRLLLPPEESEPLTAVDVAQHREVIEAAVEAVRAAVRAGLPLYGVIDHIEFMAGPPPLTVSHATCAVWSDGTTTRSSWFRACRRCDHAAWLDDPADIVTAAVPDR